MIIIYGLEKNLAEVLYKRITLPISLTSTNATVLACHHNIGMNWNSSSVNYAAAIISTTQINIAKNYNGVGVSSWDNWVAIGF